MQSFWVNLNGSNAGNRFGRYYQQLGGRGSWVLRWTSLAAGIVFIVPFILLAILAILTFLAVFLVLSTVDRILNWVGNLFSPSTPQNDNDGRQNVTVVQIEDSSP